MKSGSSKPPPPPPPPPLPVEGDVDIQAAKDNERMRARKASGRAGTILTGGLAGGADQQKKTLLGQ
jgi:hypothetical protein